MIVWVLTDEKVGSNNQSIAIAERLSHYYVIKKIVYNNFIRFPNFLRRDTLIGVNKKQSSDIKQDLPDVVVCAGRRLSSVALNIKKRSENKTFVINIMKPDLPYDKFDLILLPVHDNIPEKYLRNGNIIETHGSLTMINANRMNEEKEKWNEFFADYKRPLVSLIVGGDTKSYKYDAKEFGIMVSNLANIVNKVSGSLLITTSRRTNSECVNQIRKKSNCDHYIYDFNWENDDRNLMKSELGNPYHAFFGLSDFLVVTGDSMSMISEACSTGKPTYVYMPKKSLTKKHFKFCNEMLKYGYIKEFDKNVDYLQKYDYKPLNEIDRITQLIFKKMEENSGI
ncbi:MAG TPA: mitochondrial fission ELM1 family protein [Rickettsiales bacterium]|nr:mitochondrial fission ELM1 family protein [Rickettsiales bacterium]